MMVAPFEVAALVVVKVEAVDCKVPAVVSVLTLSPPVNVTVPPVTIRGLAPPKFALNVQLSGPVTVSVGEPDHEAVVTRAAVPPPPTSSVPAEPDVPPIVIVPVVRRVNVTAAEKVRELKVMADELQHQHHV